MNPSHLQSRDRAFKAGLLALVLVYSLFSLAPFLLLHTHFEHDHDGSHVETTHAHGWEFGSEHPGQESAGAPNPEAGDGHDEASHLGETSADHEGREGPAWAMPSGHSALFQFHPSTEAILDWLPRLPASALARRPAPIPISPGPYPDDYPAFLFGNLPPPAFA